MATMLGSLLVSLGLESAQFDRGLKRSESSLEKFTNFAGKGMLALGSAVAGASAAMGLLVRNSINVADEISKAASIIGIGTEELSRLRYAADLSGVSFESLQTGVLRLNRNMVAVTNGGKAASATFAKLGIDVMNADGSLRSSSDIMADVADKFAGMEDGAQKSALAMELFGKSGAQLIPLLNGGSAALEQLTGEADKFGIVIDAETGRKAEAFNDNVTRLKGAFEAVATQIAAELLPIMVDLTDSLVDSASGMREFARDTFQALQRVSDMGRGVKVLVADMFNLGSNTGLAGRAMANFRNILAQTFPRLRAIINLLSGIGREARTLDEVGLGAGNAMKSLSDIIADSGVVMAGTGQGAEMLGEGIAKAGKAASAAKPQIDKTLEDAKRKAEEAEQALQRLRSSFASVQEQLDPELAAQRRTGEQQGIITDAARAGIGTQDERLRALGLTLKVTDALTNMKIETINLGKITDDTLGKVADSFGTMADRALQALDRLAQGIKGGDFLSILSGVLGIGLQLGGLGVFGKNVAASINSQGRIPGFANGTRFAPGGLAMVGERGRDLVNLPRGSQVIPNRDLGGMMGPARVVVGIDPKNGNVTAFVDNQIVQAAPAIMQGGAALAGQQMSRQARRRT